MNLFILSSADYMLREIHPSCSDCLNTVWQEAQIIQLSNTNFFQPLLAFSLQLQNSPIYSASRCLQSELFLLCDRPGVAALEDSRQNFIFSILLFVVLDRRGKTKDPHLNMDDDDDDDNNNNNNN